MSESALSAGLIAELDALIKARIAEALEGMAKPKPAPGRLLTLPEAAERLRRSPSWLYHNHRRIRLGRRDGGRLVFPEATVDRYLRALERQG